MILTLVAQGTNNSSNTWYLSLFFSVFSFQSFFVFGLIKLRQNKENKSLQWISAVIWSEARGSMQDSGGHSPGTNMKAPEWCSFRQSKRQHIVMSHWCQHTYVGTHVLVLSVCQSTMRHGSLSLISKNQITLRLILIDYLHIMIINW